MSYSNDGRYGYADATGVHPHSPYTTRGARLDVSQRPDGDRTAPPPLDSAADVPAITGANDGSAQPATLGEWAAALYNALYTIAAHLLGHGNRLDHLITRVANLEAQLERPALDMPLELSAIPQRISDHGARRRHLLAYAGASTPNVVLDTGSIKLTLTLNAGWTLLDAPGDCTIYTSDGSHASIYLRATDHTAYHQG